jgi:hypothetical protein
LWKTGPLKKILAIEKAGYGAIRPDDALDEDDAGLRSYLLVVNATAREKDWNWFMGQKKKFPNLIIEGPSMRAVKSRRNEW